jgi:hypothetical protein
MGVADKKEKAKSLRIVTKNGSDDYFLVLKRYFHLPSSDFRSIGKCFLLFVCSISQKIANKKKAFKSLT